MTNKLYSVLMLALMLVLAGCSLLPKEEARRASPVNTVTEDEKYDMAYVKRGDMALTKKISLSYIPVKNENVYFKLAGQLIDEMYVSTGDSVVEGQLLGQLKLGDAESNLSAAELNLKKLKLSLTQSEEMRALALKKQYILYDSGSEELEEALKSVNDKYDKAARDINDKIDLAYLTLESRQADIEARRIYAPFGGTVTYVRSYAESDLSTLNERAVTITDSTLSVFSASTDAWELLSPGTEAIITVDKQEVAAVAVSESELGLEEAQKEAGKKAKVYFALTEPAQIKDKAKGTLVLTLETRTDVLTINENAVALADGQTIVYYLDENGVKTYKNVEVGLNAQGLYEVLSGLEDGEAVILQ